MRKRIATFLFITAALSASSAARAQSFSVSYIYYPYSRLEQVSGDPAPYAPTHLRVNALQALLIYPVVFNQGRTQFEHTFKYNYIMFDYRGTAPLLDSVQSFSLTSFFSHDFINDWGVIAVVQPGFADDFHGPATADAITMALVLAGTYKFSENLKVGLGAAFDNTYGEAVPLPVAKVDWTITERLWLNTVLPLDLHLTYLPFDMIGMRASVIVTGNSFHGDANRYNVKNPQLNYSAITTELGVRLYILPWLHLSLHGGVTLYRRYEFSDGRKSIAKYDPSNCMVFQVDLGIGR